MICTTNWTSVIRLMSQCSTSARPLIPYRIRGYCGSSGTVASMKISINGLVSSYVTGHKVWWLKAWDRVKIQLIWGEQHNLREFSRNDYGKFKFCLWECYVIFSYVLPPVSRQNHRKNKPFTNSQRVNICSIFSTHCELLNVLQTRK